MTNTCNIPVHILFYLRNSKSNKAGLTPIYCRITVNSKRSEFSLKRYVDKSRWNSSGGLMKGSKEDARTINTYLEDVKVKLRQIENNFHKEGKLPSAVSLRMLIKEKTGLV